MKPTEFKTGIKANGERLMQPPFDYINEAVRTLSPSWHGELVSRYYFNRAMNAAIVALQDLDKVKKTLFYGKENGIGPNGTIDHSNIEGLFNRVGAGGPNGMNVVHAILGAATECGELLEALRDNYNGQPQDAVNLREEVGDCFWYFAILARECGFTFEEAQRINIDKLRARFPAAFEADYANNRDLTKERKILEGATVADSDGNDGA